MIRSATTLAALAALGLTLSGCEDDAPAPPPAPPRAAAAPGTPGAPGSPNNPRAAGDEPPPPMQFSDTSFVSNIRTARDPFRSYFNTFVLTGGTVDQVRDVKLGRYSLDDLRLVAVVVGTDSPYAMVVDPSRSGTILRRGMYVGRQEFVQTPQGGYNTHWRVARIEPGRYHQLPDGDFEEVPAAVVFERSNTLDATAQVAERTITLSSGVAGMQTQQAATSIGPIPGVSGPTPGYLPSNLGGGGPGTGQSANGSLLGTQAAVQQAVRGSAPPPPPTTTTVVVQVPPQAPTLAPAPPSNAPPPVQVFNGSSNTTR